jgi:hypothetical protein
MVWELKKKKLAILTTIAVYCRLTAHRKGQIRPNKAKLHSLRGSQDISSDAIIVARVIRFRNIKKHSQSMQNSMIYLWTTADRVPSAEKKTRRCGKMLSFS